MKLRKSQAGIAHLGLLVAILVLVCVVALVSLRVIKNTKLTTTTNESSQQEVTDKIDEAFSENLSGSVAVYKNEELGFTFNYPKEWGSAELVENECEVAGSCSGWRAFIRFDETSAEGNAAWVDLYSDDAYTVKDGSRMFAKGYRLEQGQVYSIYNQAIIPSAEVKNGSHGQYAFYDAKEETAFREAKNPLMYGGINLTKNPKYKGLQVFSGFWNVQQKEFLELMDSFEVLE